MRNMYACVYECVYVWQRNESRETERDSEYQGMHLKILPILIVFTIWLLTFCFLKKINTTINIKTNIKVLKIILYKNILSILNVSYFKYLGLNFNFAII